MELTQALSVNRIDLNAEASTKKKALELVSETCASMQERSDFFQALVDREKLGSTGIGHGVALPHARLENLETPIACFFRLNKPVDFEAPDQEPVDLVLGLFVPEDGSDTHLKLLSGIAVLFNDDAMRQKLRESEDAQQVFDIISQYKGDAALAS